MIVLYESGDAVEVEQMRSLNTKFDFAIKESLADDHHHVCPFRAIVL